MQQPTDAEQAQGSGTGTQEQSGCKEAHGGAEQMSLFAPICSTRACCCKSAVGTSTAAHERVLLFAGMSIPYVGGTGVTFRHARVSASHVARNCNACKTEMLHQHEVCKHYSCAHDSMSY